MRIDTKDAEKRDEDYESDEEGGIEEKIKEVSFIKSRTF